MKLEDIGFYTLSDARAKFASITSPLWRCELILSDDCNFNCPYCMKIREDYSKTLTYEEAQAIVSMWCDGGMKHVRYSGGEPTLWKGLKDLVAYSKARGVEKIALSTNGSAPTKYYLDLVAAGVNDFSISLDACCAATGEEMAGKKGIYQRVIDNIKILSSITYVTVGVVLTETNMPEFKDIVKLASEDLGATDIRIITAAQWNAKVPGDLLPKSIINKHPILRYRMNNYDTGRNIRGLTPTDHNKCPLVLDDMAVAGDKHFPCIIYMRQRGDPIGKMTGSIQEVRKARENWYLKTDTHKDSICNRICLDVCVDYNNKYRELRG